jgi:predicted RNA-binding Zn-ribbon protein involved in translation (DUF1610 family)
MPLYDPRTQKPAALIPGRPYPRFWGPPPDMGFTFGSFDCAQCQNQFSTQNGVSVFCPYCGNQQTQKTELLESGEIADAIKNAPFGSVSLACPHCGSATVTDSADTELAQLSQVFCTQCGGDISTELGKLGTSQNQQSVSPKEGEMLLSRKATTAVAKLLASHGIESTIEKVEKDRFRLEAQEELPESLSQEVKDTINDIDSLDRALDEEEEKSQDETTEESPIMANKAKKKVKGQETPVEVPVDETPVEESQDEEDPSEESQDEEIMDEASAMKVSSALNKAGVNHTITKVAKNGYVVKAQEETPVEEPTEEASDDQDEDDAQIEDEIPMTEQEAEATSAQLKKAGVSHTITRVQKGFIVRAQEVEPTDLETVSQPEPEKETEEDGQYGFPPYTEKAEGEDVVTEQVANKVSAQLKKAGVSHTITRVSKTGYVVKAQEVEEPEEIATDDQDEDDAQTEEPTEESQEEIYTEDQATAVSSQLKKAGIQHTITRVSKRGYVIAQEIPVEPEPEMVSQDEETEPTEEEGQEEAPIEEVTEGKVLNANQADKLSASLKKKGVKHSITRVSKTGYVIAQLDDTEEGQYGFPPYTDPATEMSQEEKVGEEKPAETSQEEPPVETPEEAVLHEALSNLDELEGVTVSDLGMTLYDEETDNPHYNLDVKGKPVAAIFLDDQPKPEELRASFVRPEVYGKNFCSAVEKLGLKEVLSQVKARLWTVKVETNKYAQQMQAKVEANFASQHAVKVAGYTANFAHAFNVAIAGLNKNFFTDMDNPLKMALYSALKDRGIDDAVEVIESSFASAADPFFKTVLAKAEEIMAKPKEVVDELARTIASVNPVKVEDNAQSYQTLGHRLGSNSVPVVAQASENRRSLSRHEYKEDIKRRVRLGGTQG